MAVGDYESWGAGLDPLNGSVKAGKKVRGRNRNVVRGQKQLKASDERGQAGD